MVLSVCDVKCCGSPGGVTGIECSEGDDRGLRWAVLG